MPISARARSAEYRVPHFDEIDPNAMVAVDSTSILRRRYIRKYLEDIMKAKGWNIAQFAAMCGLHHSYLSRIISGHRTPSLHTAMVLSVALERPLAEVANVLVGAGGIHAT